MHARFVGDVLNYLINISFPAKIPMVRNEAVLEFLIDVPARLAHRGGGKFMATITLDILIYSCGIPLFISLMLATPGIMSRWAEILKGLCWLVVYEVLAMYVSACYNTINMLHIIGADTRWLLDLPWNPHLNLFAQTTFALVLPSALAVFLWAAYHSDYFMLQHSELD
jgi:hypothetical protein